jgi:hypothetical protein
MKKSLLFAWVLLFLMSTQTYADKHWNLMDWSVTTLANLEADTVVNWKQESATRFSNRIAFAADAAIMANGVAIAEMDGLTLGAMAIGKLRIDFNTNPGRLMLNGSGLKLNVPDCKAGDTLTVVTYTASSSTARGVTTSANCTRIGGDELSLEVDTNVFLITADGPATFTTTGGLHFREITLTNPKLAEVTVAPYWVKDTAAFVPDSNYFYAITGFNGTKPEESWLAEQYVHFAYANGTSMAVEAVGDTANIKYYWNFEAGANAGTYKIKNVQSGLYLDGATSGTEYAALSLSASAIDFTIADFRTAGTKSGVVCANSGRSYASFMPFGILYGSNRTLLKGYMWRKMLLKRSDCVSFLYAYPKAMVYKPALGKDLDQAKALAARTITEGVDLLNYATGLKASLQTAITAAQAAYDGSDWKAMEAAMPALKNAVAAFKAGFVLPAEKYNLKAGTEYVGLLTDTTFQLVSAVAQAAMINGAKSETGTVQLSYGTKYLGTDGALTTTPVDYEAVIDNNLVTFIAGADTLKIGGASAFSLSVVVIPLKPSLKATTPVDGALNADTTDILIEFDQAIQVLDPSKITLNGVQATCVVNEKTLTVTDPMTYKTDYVLQIKQGAIAHADDATLIADSVGVTFATRSLFLRDKQTMLGAGAFAGVYALFGEGNASGYMDTQRQIAADANGQLWCGLSNALSSQWALVLADTTNKVWNVKNHVTGKYLAWGEDSALVVSEAAAGWQISLNASAPSNNDWVNVYTFWPAVSGSAAEYDMALRVDSMKLMASEANGTVTTNAFRVCPMESLTFGDIQNYTDDSYLKIGARNTGELACQVAGVDSVLFSATPAVAEGSHWKVKRVENGRYVFQNRLTKQYITYVNDSTVMGTATYTPGSDDQEWVIMAHCSRSGTNYYTVQGRKLAMYGGVVNGGYLSVTARNGGNDTKKPGGAARMQLKTTGTTFVAGEGKPTVSVASVTSKALTINWTENMEANRYVVRVADTLHYMNGDSIGYNHIDSVTIYEQIPYMVDSVCLRIDTVAATTYKASNLETGVAYHFKVQAMDAKGNLGVISDMVSDTTVSLSQHKPSPPTVGAVTVSSVSLSWAANEEAVNYTVSYWTKADTSDLALFTTTGLECTLGGILADSKVYFTLKVNGSDTASMASDAVTATTLSYSSLTMAKPTTSNVTDHSMKVSWEAVEAAVSYNLYVANAPSLLASATPISVTELYTVLDQLKANYGYYMQVAAVNAVGAMSQRSSVVSKRTNAAGVINVGYITFKKAMDASADSVENDPIYRMLSAEANLNVTLNVLADAGAAISFDQSPYNVLVIQESMSGSAGILTPGKALGLSNLTIPTLYNKTYAFKAKRALASDAAGSGAEATTYVLSLSVAPANQTNPLFAGLTFDGDSVVVFTETANDLGAVGTKALNIATGVTGVEGTLLAYPTGMTPAICVNDIPAGTNLGGQTLNARIITFGMNFGALCRLSGANITPANYTLWKNAVNILGGNIPVGLDKAATLGMSVYPNPTSDYINLRGLSDKTTVKLYSLTGQLISTQRTEGESLSLNLTSFDAGIYLLQVESAGSKQTIKVIKR